MRKAFTVWAEALGAVPNGVNGHSLSWKELMDIKNAEGEYTPRYCFMDEGEWNPKVPGDTLAVHMVKKGATPQATIGYITNGEADRHKIVLPENPGLYQVVHEIGHVLGMVHEQCRNDRDTFIQYRCQNIRGYGKSLTDAIMAGETDVENKLCGDKIFAEKYNIDGSQVTKNAQYADLPGILDEAEFDMGSIMMYPSNAFSNPECGPEKMEKCPMVGIDRVDGKVTGTSWIHGSVVPSAGDIAFVKKWYPWND